MSNPTAPELNDSLSLNKAKDSQDCSKKGALKAAMGWLPALVAPCFSYFGRYLGHQASLEKLNRLLLGAVTVGFLVTIATYGWVVHQKFTLQQLIQETQSLQESNTAHSIQLNRLQSFTGIMKNAQTSRWLSEPKETLTLLTPIGQPLPQALPQPLPKPLLQAAMPSLGGAELSSNERAMASQRWPLVTGY